MKLLKKRNQGFTLIEILIVVSLLAILAVAALVAINPAEAQKKARDAQRLKEVADLQKIMEQYLADNPSAAGFTQSSSANSSSNACANTGWLGVDVCNYANTIVVDPRNITANAIYTKNTGLPGTGANMYQVLLNGSGQYRICTRLEAKANSAKLNSDGLANDYYELYNSTSASTCTIP